MVQLSMVGSSIFNPHSAQADHYPPAGLLGDFVGIGKPRLKTRGIGERTSEIEEPMCDFGVHVPR